MKNILYISLLTALLFCISACAQEKRNTQKNFDGLDSEIETLIAEHHAAGVAVAVVKDGKTIYSKGFGYRDYENKLPVNEHTVFGIGSCTKAFTASVLGILQDEGKLKFSEKPAKYIQNLEFFNQGMNDSIQIKNLLTHSTGVNSRPSESMAILFITPNKYELIPRIKHIKPATGVDKGWIYNNLMYSVAGMVAEKASGISLEDNWQQKIFNPLEMNNTYVGWKPASKNKNFSHGYAVDSITPSRVLQEDMSTRAAGGSIYSSVHDMSKWMQLWLNEGAFENKQILSTKYVKSATDFLNKLPDNPRDSLNPVARYYGYGWGNWNHKGYKRVEHSGGTSGYVSNVVMYPEEKLGIVVLSNQTTTTLSSKINNRIVERLYPTLTENNLATRFGQTFTIEPVDTPTIQDSENRPSYKLSDLIGTYTHPGFGEFTISLTDQTLFAEFPLTKFRLEYTGENTFIDHHSTQIPLTYWNFMNFVFQENTESKGINSVAINLDTAPVIFTKHNN
ncbi:serine hydrolase [Psychroserpens sp.]|uniref:serine hydrolase n=1 Tax=Psychroserpens sp. TaxID=2020870 RepID=UPI003859E0F9